VRREPGDFFQLGEIVVCDERFVSVQHLEGFLRLGRVRIDNSVPDKILLLFWRQVFDIFVNQHELRQGGDVEARAGFVKSAHDSRLGIGLDGIIGLHLGKMLFEFGVVPADFVVIDHHHRGAVIASERLELLAGHDNSIKSLLAFKQFCYRAQGKKEEVGNGVMEQWERRAGDE